MQPIYIVRKVWLSCMCLMCACGVEGVHEWMYCTVGVLACVQMGQEKNVRVKSQFITLCLSDPYHTYFVSLSPSVTLTHRYTHAHIGYTHTSNSPTYILFSLQILLKLYF